MPTAGPPPLYKSRTRYIVALLGSRVAFSQPNRVCTVVRDSRSVELKVDLGQTESSAVALSRNAYRDLARYDLFPERTYSRALARSLACLRSSFLGSLPIRRARSLALATDIRGLSNSRA